MFAAVLVVTGSIVGYYYGSFVNEDFTDGGSRLNICDESVMNVTRKSFLKWGNQPLETATDRNIVQHSV